MKAQLAKPLEINAELIVNSSNWWAERKYDGERVLTFVDEFGVHCYGRKGTEIQVPTAIKGLNFSVPIVLDGEIVNGVDYYVFDILRRDRENLMRLPYATRRKILEEVLGPDGVGRVHVVDVAVTTYEKAMLVKTLRLAGEEGVVFKDITGRYYPGKRSAKWLKLKFTNTCEVVLTELNRFDPTDGQHHPEGAGFMFYDDTEESGSIKVPIGKQANLNVGDIIEVKYLRVEKSGRLYQPVFLRKRTDKQANECLRSQLNDGIMNPL
jgi:ATP-dependent DNA ligase